MIFCEPDEAAGDMAFTPLRWAEITSFGPMEMLDDKVALAETRLAITFKLGPFVETTPQTQDMRVKEATTQLRRLTTRPYLPNQGGADSRWVVFADHEEARRKIAGETRTATSPEAAWLAHAGHLSKCASLARAHIFRVYRPQYLDWRGRYQSASIVQDSLLGDAYRLRGSKQYKLVVRFFHSGREDADPTTLVQATVSSAKVRSTAPIRSAQGQETEATIFFGSEPLANDELATVTVEGPSGAVAQRNQTVAFVVRFRPRWWAIVIGTFLIMVGILVSGLSASDWKELSLHFSAGYLFVIKLVGALAAALGAFTAFRRGPGGG